MPPPWISLLVLHIVMLAMGSAVFWAAKRRPWIALLVSGIVVAGGSWALWSAGGAMEADGPDVGQIFIVIGQWLVALGIAACGLVFVVRRNRGTTAAFVGPTAWPKALVTYWFMCFGIALFEGIIIFLGRTPHGQFR
jgi:hypothetical protein